MSKENEKHTVLVIYNSIIGQLPEVHSVEHGIIR